MAWHLEGTYFENCNCDVLCPCGASSLVLPADKERCHVVLAYHVERGEIEVEDFVPEGESEPSRPTGAHHPSSSTLTVARATHSRINAFGMEFDNEGKNGHTPPYSWAA